MYVINNFQFFCFCLLKKINQLHLKILSFFLRFFSLSKLYPKGNYNFLQKTCNLGFFKKSIFFYNFFQKKGFYFFKKIDIYAKNNIIEKKGCKNYAYRLNFHRQNRRYANLFNQHNLKPSIKNRAFALFKKTIHFIPSQAKKQPFSLFKKMTVLSLFMLIK